MSSKYFWSLDHEISRDYILGYQDALKNEKNSTLKKQISLLAAKVPTLPKAYVTSALVDFVDGKLPNDFYKELGDILGRIEKLTHSQFGGDRKHLLLTVRGDFCGSIRNIGSCIPSLRSMIHQHGKGMAFTLYVDFLESFSTQVLNCGFIDFRKTFSIRSNREGGAGGLDEVSEDDFVRYVKDYENLVSQRIGRAFPDRPEQQLVATIIHCTKIGRDSGGDEIFVQAQMPRTQFGESIHGLAYTRNPFTGEKNLYGVYECGSDEKKGILEPDSDLGEKNTLRDRFPTIYAGLKRHLPEVEACFRDVMEAEFVTDEDGNLFFSSFDKAETTARATVISAVELAMEGKITDLEAAVRIKPNDVEVLLHPTLDESSRKELKDLGSQGVTAAPGTAVGHVFFKMADAMEFHQRKKKAKEDHRVILIADELLISDTPGLGIISGLVTRQSGIASHAAVMARANGIPCMVGYKGLDFDPSCGSMIVNDSKYEAGSLMTLEAGGEGRLYLGEGKLQNLSHEEGVVKECSRLLSRVIEQERVPIEVRVNINNAKDAKKGVNFGATGVGLCRTENMFMSAEALREVRRIVFHRGDENRDNSESLKKLEEIQFEDYRKIFDVMGERVVNIRLMDLPLHDFAPHGEKELEEVAQDLDGVSKEELAVIADELREHNPMLGLRACRYGLIQPGLYEMQVRAIIRAAYDISKRGVRVDPGIMFPLVVSPKELEALREKVLRIDHDIREELKVPFGSKINVRVGTMIELPAAALAADRLAKMGEFFAFGTNDLSQTTLGISRDDSAHYLPQYLEKEYLPNDPFKVLNPSVRELIDLAVRRGRRVRPDASFGICGEQGGDKGSLEFCFESGLNYVSCSPFRVLPTRAALVQVALGPAGLLKLQREANQSMATAISEPAPRPKRSPAPQRRPRRRAG